jgi:hypothetical protein
MRSYGQGEERFLAITPAADYVPVDEVKGS